MAPRRVGPALANDTEDTLADSIRQDVLGAGADDQDADQQIDDADDQDADQQLDGADDQDADQQLDDADDQDADQQQEPEQRRRAPARQERNTNQLSPEAEARIATAERIAAEAVARADAMMQQFGQPRETAEQEAARLATMTPEQQIDYKLNKALIPHRQAVQQATFDARNSADKASFDATIATNPQLKRFASEVERKHADFVRENARTGNAVPSRQMVLTYMLGEKALELAQKAAPQAQARTRRVAQQNTRPGSARSEVAPGRRQSSTVEQRLEGVAL